MFNHYIHLLLRPIAISQTLHGQSDSCILVIVQSKNVAERGKIPALFLYVQETAKFCGCTLKILLFSEATWATVVLTDACPRQLHVTAMNIIHVTATSGKEKKHPINSMWIPYYIIFYPEHTSGAFFKRIPPTKTLYHVQLGIFGSALVICTSSGRIHYCTWLKKSLLTIHLNSTFKPEVLTLLKRIQQHHPVFQRANIYVTVTVWVFSVFWINIS